MPNWIINHITFMGTKNKVQYIRDSIQECIEKNVGIMNHFVPRPRTYDTYDTTNHHSANMKVGEIIYFGTDTVKEVKATQEFIDRWKDIERIQKDKYGAVGWYDWNRKYWGTKWDMCDAVLRDAYLECSTAWTAPVEFCKTLSKKFPNVTIYMQSAYADGSHCAWLFKNGNERVTGVTDDFYTYTVKHYDEEDE